MPSTLRRPGLEARRDAIAWLQQVLKPDERRALGDVNGVGATDDLDRASSVQGRNDATMLAEFLTASQVQIDHAMRRFTDGHYGSCEDCQRTIPRERHIAWPEATRCVECQRRYELRTTARF